jgi:hypothetical protein
MRKTFWAIVISVLAPTFTRAADLNIPAQPLEQSLSQFSRLSGVPVTFTADLVKGKNAPALLGPFSIEGALDTMLAKSGLTYHVLETGAIEIAVPMDEVQVRGKYEKLSAMRKEYELLEDKFYDEYNKLNTNHDYDVECSLDGGFVKSRECVPVFVDRAYRDAGWGSGGSEGFGGAAEGWNAFNNGAAWVWIQAKMPDYQQNMRDQVRKNPKLLELLMKRNAAAERYQTVRKKKFAGAKIFVWDCERTEFTLAARSTGDSRSGTPHCASTDKSLAIFARRIRSIFRCFRVLSSRENRWTTIVVAQILRATNAHGSKCHAAERSSRSNPGRSDRRGFNGSQNCKNRIRRFEHRQESRARRARGM